MMDTSFDTSSASAMPPSGEAPTLPCPPVLWHVVGRFSGVAGGMTPTPPGPPALTPDAAAAAWATARRVATKGKVLCRCTDDHDGLGTAVIVEIAPQLTYSCRVVSVHGGYRSQGGHDA